MCIQRTRHEPLQEKCVRRVGLLLLTLFIERSRISVQPGSDVLSNDLERLKGAIVRSSKDPNAAGGFFNDELLCLDLSPVLPCHFMFLLSLLLLHFRIRI